MRLHRMRLHRITLGVAGLLCVAALGAYAAITPGESARLQNSARIVSDIRGSIPPDYWARARCVVVIPELRKAAFVVGGEYGRGVMSCRAGDQWSAPMFMQLAKGSWGFQAGAEQIDLVLLVMNESGVQKLLQNKVTLGMDAAVAAGPVGAQGTVGTDAALTAEILSYSRAQGLFAGINVSGGVLRADEDSNTSVYGTDASARRILASRGLIAPREAVPLLEALNAGASNQTASGAKGTEETAKAAQPAPTAGTTTSGTTTPGTTTAEPNANQSDRRAGPRSTAEEDVHVRAVDLRQSIDRLLADAAPAPTGTSGTTAPAPAGEVVMVDRARLVQLRQQVDALIGALEKR